MSTLFKKRSEFFNIPNAAARFPALIVEDNNTRHAVSDNDRLRQLSGLRLSEPLRGFFDPLLSAEADLRAILKVIDSTVVVSNGPSSIILEKERETKDQRAAQLATLDEIVAGIKGGLTNYARGDHLSIFTRYSRVSSQKRDLATLMLTWCEKFIDARGVLDLPSTSIDLANFLNANENATFEPVFDQAKRIFNTKHAYGRSYSDPGRISFSLYVTLLFLSALNRKLAHDNNKSTGRLGEILTGSLSKVVKSIGDARQLTITSTLIHDYEKMVEGGHLDKVQDSVAQQDEKQMLSGPGQ